MMMTCSHHQPFNSSSLTSLKTSFLNNFPVVNQTCFSEVQTMADKQKSRKKNDRKHGKGLYERDVTMENKCGQEVPDTKVRNGARVLDNTVMKDVNERKLLELSEAFHLFDFDRDGIISFSDLKKVYSSLDSSEIDDEQIKRMIAESWGPLDFEAFVKMMGCKLMDLDDEQVLVEALSQWDYGSGLISEEKIKHDIMTWGDRFTAEEAEAALEHAPKVLTETNEKMINYIKFSNELCGFHKSKGYRKETREPI